MTDQRELIDEQIAYYRARASEYDDWWFRRGRYDRGEEQRRAWDDEIGHLERALDEAGPDGTVLELACGTGIWTQRLVRSASWVTAVDASPEVLAINRARVGSSRVHYVREDLFEWQPQQQFDFVFFGFWLSHVPSDQFDRFWATVQESLKPAGKVFFIDSLRTEESTATNHILPDSGNAVMDRQLDNGRHFRIFKIFYAPPELQNRLEMAGWTGSVRTTGAYFLHGCVRRL
jgi:demethylmenaquinone methyltransferase/2-methoxy-6-polyprenyl-1,4-benzoquinol methylase